MTEILPGGKANPAFQGWLDEIARAFLALRIKDSSGMESLVPVIFRPFHENTGSWFWWGADHCTPGEFIAVWRWTVDYLRKKGVHNVLYAYSPSDPAKRKETYGERYPGDAYVDIIAWDQYHRTHEAVDDFRRHFLNNCQIVVSFAEDHGKVAAWTEGGPYGGFDLFTHIPDWYSECLLQPLEKDTNASKLVYWMQWNSQKQEKRLIPLPGCVHHEDYLRFHDHHRTLFLSDMRKAGQNQETYADNDLSNQHIQLYPNPADDKIYITGLEQGNTISIANLLGTTVLDKVAYQNHEMILFENQPSGVYFVFVMEQEAIIGSCKFLVK